MFFGVAPVRLPVRNEGLPVRWAEIAVRARGPKGTEADFEQEGAEVTERRLGRKATKEFLTTDFADFAD